MAVGTYSHSALGILVHTDTLAEDTLEAVHTPAVVPAETARAPRQVHLDCNPAQDTVEVGDCTWTPQRGY